LQHESWRRGDYTVTIRVGAVVDALSPAPAVPAVSGVLGSNVFEREARVHRIAVDGPIPGASTLFVIKLKP
jgi:hypothetical protein